MSSVWTIRRSTTDVKLAGLCAGIAEHWNVDPVIVRVGTVLLALSGGIGVVLYVAGWLLVPMTGRDDPPLYEVFGQQARTWPRELWIGIVALTCIIAVSATPEKLGFGIGPAVILALIWYFGYYKSRANRPGAAGSIPASPDASAGTAAAAPQFVSYSGPPTPFTDAADAWRARVKQAYEQGGATYRGVYDSMPGEDLSEPTGPAASLPPAHPLGAESVAYQAYLSNPDPVGLYVPATTGSVSVTPTRRSRAGLPAARRLRLVSLLAVGLTLTGLGVADAAGVAVPSTVYLASTLLVLGLTLVVAAWVGRARGILPVALLMLVATVGSSVAGMATQQEGWGSVHRTYTSATELVAEDHHRLGELQVDMADLTSKTDETYTARVERGMLEVVAPRSMNVVVNWQLGAGTVRLNGQEVEGGTQLRGVRWLATDDPRKKTLVLNLSVHQGMVEVVQR